MHYSSPSHSSLSFPPGWSCSCSLCQTKALGKPWRGRPTDILAGGQYLWPTYKSLRDSLAQKDQAMMWGVQISKYYKLLGSQQLLWYVKNLMSFSPHFIPHTERLEIAIYGIKVTISYASNLTLILSI